MNNFDYYNPTRIIFGKDTIASLRDRLPAGVKVMLCYGGGLIKKNGVYDQVLAALAGRDPLCGFSLGDCDRAIQGRNKRCGRPLKNAERCWGRTRILARK